MDGRKVSELFVHARNSVDGGQLFACFSIVSMRDSVKPFMKLYNVSSYIFGLQPTMYIEVYAILSFESLPTQCRKTIDYILV